MSAILNQTDTIAAISTAMNNSGIGIIRISGDEAFTVINRIFKPMKKDKNMSAVQSHTVHYGTIIDGDQVVDEVLVLIMKGPHTYTREDTVEIDCHGGIYVMNKIMDLVLRSGARAAEPGEFTKRAFLNGRIDLSQAEAVIDVINAQNDYALKSAVTQLKGSVSEKIKALRARILEQIAYIEAALDDPEHIEMEGYGEILLPMLTDCRDEISKLIRTADDGRIIKEGIQTVILGKPNVGKSSLLNALLGIDRAIVTQIPGTTRDALEESLRLDDITLNIIDTAGIRDTDDIVEQLGVEKSREYASSADLIIWMIDSSRELDQDDLDILELIRDKKTIIILNKQDLPSITGRSVFEEKIGSEVSEIPIIELSAHKGTGIDELISKVRELFYNKQINFNDQVYITNLRQKEALSASRESLSQAVNSIEMGMSEDFFTIDMMDAYAALGRVVGESVEDDLADEIFSKFCMGK